MAKPADIGRVLCLGTRGSALARWQTDYVSSLIQAALPTQALAVDVLTTRGDRILDTPLPLIGGKGIFTAELEAALYCGAIDLAVHSLKDLPTNLPPGLAIGAIPRRAAAGDVVVSRSGRPLEDLPAGATVGTSSRRRAAQLHYHFPHLQTADIRGNVDTRIRHALDPAGPYDAIILAQAGVDRLCRSDVVTQVLTPTQMLPAPGQGALAVQCRDDAALRALLAPIEDADTRAAVTAERAFLAGLGGGCSLPIAAFAQFAGDVLHLHGRVIAPDGSTQIDITIDGSPDEAVTLGARLAHLALAQGAARLLTESA